MTIDRGVDTQWGPLSEPIHGPVPQGRPAWKDNAYLSFWDPPNRVFGTVHVSTSPNAEGRRARFSLSIAGRVIEIVEELQPGTFRSDSITFGLDDTVIVDSPDLSGTLTNLPRFAMADYSTRSIIPPTVAGEPLQHFQRAARVHGRFTLSSGQSVTFNGDGFRDRTWGYRDESTSIVEYIAIMAVFDDRALTAMRFIGTDGSDRTEGYLLDENRAIAVNTIKVTRDAAGLLASASFPLQGKPDLGFTSLGRVGGFWVPMGWTRRGPAMSAFDEFTPVRTSTGEDSFAMIEHGILRNLF
jgi:hypothetical protein